MMGPVRFSLLVVAACIGFTPLGTAQQRYDRQLFPEADSAAQHPPARHIPVFDHADEFALAAAVEYFDPEPGFDRQNRDIDLQVARIALSAHLLQGWEFLFDGLALRAHGTRTMASLAANPPQVAGNALAIGSGPMARWNFLQFSRCRLFMDAGGDLFLADRPFPNHGTVYDFFLRAGGGVSVRVSDSYWIESVFHFAHISNGQGFGPGNPTWQGSGLSIGVRRAFGHRSETRGQPWRMFRNADEKAWITSAEYYAPLPGFPRTSNFQGDLRALRVSRAWHFPHRIEFQLGGVVQRTDSATGFGPLLRWNFLDTGHWRLFADGGADFLQTGSPAFIIPWSGDGYHFMLRGGGGASFQLHPSYWLEAGVRSVHVTSGFGSGAGNYPRWSGEGLSVGLRHTFH